MVGTVKEFMTPRGDVLADPRTNTLIIRDIPSSIPKIDNLLRQIDRKSQQVEIRRTGRADLRVPSPMKSARSSDFPFRPA